MGKQRMKRKRVSNNYAGEAREGGEEKNGKAKRNLSAAKRGRGRRYCKNRVPVRTGRGGRKCEEKDAGEGNLSLSHHAVFSWSIEWRSNRYTGV